MELTEYHSKYLYTRKLNLDIKQQQKNSYMIRDHILKNFSGLPTTYVQDLSVTKYYAYYNYLMMTLPGINQLFHAIKETFHTCNHIASDGNPPEKEYYIQCWLNFYNKGEHIDWHGHLSGGGLAWHGFYCVDVEPNSYTSYIISGQNVEVKSENNLLVMGKSYDDVHRSSEWTEEKPRITVAFDINPVKNFNKLEQIENETGRIHYWIPI